MSSESTVLGLQENSEGGDEYLVSGGNVPSNKSRPDVVAQVILGMAPEPQLELETAA